MARRDSAASRSSAKSSRSSSSRTSGAGPRVRSDGKVDIYCPQCGAHYRLAEDALETKVSCTECKRTFFAKTVAGKRAKAPDYTKVYLAFGGGALLIIGTLVLLNNSGGTPAQRPVTVVSGPSQLDLDRQARRDQITRWARSIGNSDLITLRNYSDMPVLLKQLGVDAGLGGDAQEKAILAALKTNDCTRLFGEMEVSSADTSAEAVEKGQGTAVIYLSVKAGNDFYDAKAGAQVTVQWRMDGSQLKVADFTVSAKPVIRGKRPGDESKYFKPSEEIAKPKTVEIDLNGRKKAVRESEPTAIAHLPDVPQETRDKIDKLVADLLRSGDEDAPAALFARSSNALQELGRPAMARVINALHDLYGDVNANNMKLSQVTRCLQQLTGMAFAYDVRGSGDAAKDKIARESVVKQWFAWWWRYANDNYQEAIDQTEDLDSAPAKKDTPAKKDSKDAPKK